MNIDAKSEKEQKLFDFLFEKYGAIVDVKDASRILKKSRASLYRDRKEGKGVKYIQDTENGAIRYPIHEIARYVCNTEEKEVKL